MATREDSRSHRPYHAPEAGFASRSERNSVCGPACGRLCHAHPECNDPDPPALEKQTIPLGPFPLEVLPRDGSVLERERLTPARHSSYAVAGEDLMARATHHYRGIYLRLVDGKAAPRDLDLGKNVDSAHKTIAYYHASMMPPPDEPGPVDVDRKSAPTAAALIETPAQARHRVAEGGAVPLLHYIPTPPSGAAASAGAKVSDSPHK